MSQKKEEILKKNLAFVYGRNQGEELQDPDKHAFIRGSRAEKLEKEFEGPPITSFTGEYEFLSPSFPCQVCLGSDFNSPYPSFEHALVASKLEYHPDKNSLRDAIKVCSSAREAKQLVNKAGGDYSWWKDKSNAIAEVLLRDKFFRSKELRSKLIRTERRSLVFGNDYNEVVWGVHQPTGKGENHLGKLLVKLRYEISKGDDLIAWVKHSVIGQASPQCGEISVLVKEGDTLIESDCKVIRSAGLFMAAIGKHSNNDIVLRHESASSSHAIAVIVPTHVAEAAGAQLPLSPKCLVIIDLESVYKTRVDGQVIAPYQPVAITKNSILSFGASSSRYQLDCSDQPPSDSRNVKQDLYKRIVDSGAVGEAIEKGRLDNTVYIGNLPFTLSEAALRALLAPCGDIASFNYPKDRATGQTKGFALVTFTLSSSVTKALFRDGDEVDGRKIRVKRAERVPTTSESGASRESGQKRNAEDYYGLQKRAR